VSAQTYRDVRTKRDKPCSSLIDGLGIQSVRRGEVACDLPRLLKRLLQRLFRRQRESVSQGVQFFSNVMVIRSTLPRVSAVTVSPDADARHRADGRPVQSATRGANGGRLGRRNNSLYG